MMVRIDQRHRLGRVVPGAVNGFEVRLHHRSAYVYIGANLYTKVLPMRTNVEVDDELIKEAQELSGLKTKRAVVDAALRMFVRVQHQKDILKMPARSNGRAIWMRCVRVASLMTLVDSSVWINQFDQVHHPAVERLRAIISRRTPACRRPHTCAKCSEVFTPKRRRASSSAHSARYRARHCYASPGIGNQGCRELSASPQARHHHPQDRRRDHRHLLHRAGHALLHSDRDFEPMERFLGLQTV